MLIEIRIALPDGPGELYEGRAMEQAGHALGILGMRMRALAAHDDRSLRIPVVIPGGDDGGSAFIFRNDCRDAGDARRAIEAHYKHCGAEVVAMSRLRGAPLLPPVELDPTDQA